MDVVVEDVVVIVVDVAFVFAHVVVDVVVRRGRRCLVDVRSLCHNCCRSDDVSVDAVDVNFVDGVVAMVVVLVDVVVVIDVVVVSFSSSLLPSLCSRLCSVNDAVDSCESYSHLCSVACPEKFCGCKLVLDNHSIAEVSKSCTKILEKARIVHSFAEDI